MILYILIYMYGKYEDDMRIATLLLRSNKNRYPSEILQKLVEFSEKNNNLNSERIAIMHKYHVQMTVYGVYSILELSGIFRNLVFCLSTSNIIPEMRVSQITGHINVRKYY